MLIEQIMITGVNHCSNVACIASAKQCVQDMIFDGFDPVIYEVDVTECNECNEDVMTCNTI